MPSSLNISGAPPPMFSKVLPELFRVALNAADFNGAAQPILSFLVNHLPAIGAIVLEREYVAQSIEEEANLSFAGSLAVTHWNTSGNIAGNIGGNTHWNNRAADWQRRTLMSGFFPRVTYGPAPSSELARALVMALSSPHAPAVASGFSGQTFSLCLSRDDQGQPLQVLGLYTFQPLGLDSEAEERFLMVAEFLAPLLSRILQEESWLRQREASLRALGLALEVRGADPAGYGDTLTHWVMRLGKHVGFSDSDLQALRWGSYLHDIGKLGIPDSILLNTGKLEVHEWQIMHLHPQDGLRFVRELGPLPALTLQVIAEHHERFDGTGYPFGLQGAAISRAARVFSIADAFNSLTSSRPFRQALEIPEALEELQFYAGKQFDPELLSQFFELFDLDATPDSIVG